MASRSAALISLGCSKNLADSERLFGITGNETELPKAVLRGGAHLEWWLPHSANGTFAVVLDGAMSPDDDRLFIYDAAKPVGQIWVDGRLDYRFLLSDLISVRPGVRAQFALICGVSDDVIHVSMTSGSPVKALPPHCAHASTGGADSSGSTGNCSSVASTGSPHPSQYQTGNGTP